MRRLLSLAVLLGVLLAGAPLSFLRAQTVPFDLNSALASTYCIVYADLGVMPVSVMNMRALKDTALLEEVVAHEEEHQKQYIRQPALCTARTYADVLQMEVGAYCVSADVRMKYGSTPRQVWDLYLTYMQQQFDGHLPPEDVRAAWVKGCGRLRGSNPS